MLKISMEEIEQTFPEKLDYVLLSDPHGHSPPCVEWMLSKEDALKLLKAYVSQRLFEVLNIKTQLQKESKANREELFYDHTSNRIYQRTLNNHR